MKTLTLILTLSIGFQYAFTQEQDTIKVTTAKVFRISDDSITEGYLYQLRDASISLSSSPVYTSPSAKFHEIDVMDIQKIHLHRKGEGGKRLLIGFVSGFAIGGLLGYASGGSSGTFISFSAGETALMTGIISGIGGGLIYGIAGARSSVMIYGDQETYYRKNRTLKKHLLKE